MFNRAVVILYGPVTAKDSSVRTSFWCWQHTIEKKNDKIFAIDFKSYDELCKEVCEVRLKYWCQ